MSATWNRRGIGIAFMAVLTALGLLAKPPIGAAQSSREADGARLLKGALDLHFHMDPWIPGAVNGQAGIAEVGEREVAGELAVARRVPGDVNRRLLPCIGPFDGRGRGALHRARRGCGHDRGRGRARGGRRSTGRRPR